MNRQDIISKLTAAGITPPLGASEAYLDGAASEAQRLGVPGFEDYISPAPAPTSPAPVVDAAARRRVPKHDEDLEPTVDESAYQPLLDAIERAGDRDAAVDDVRDDGVDLDDGIDTDGDGNGVDAFEELLNAVGRLNAEGR